MSTIEEQLDQATNEPFLRMYTVSEGIPELPTEIKHFKNEGLDFAFPSDASWIGEPSLAIIKQGNVYRVDVIFDEETYEGTVLKETLCRVTSSGPDDQGRWCLFLDPVYPKEVK